MTGCHSPRGVGPFVGDRCTWESRATSHTFDASAACSVAGVSRSAHGQPAADALLTLADVTLTRVAEQRLIASLCAPPRCALEAPPQSSFRHALSPGASIGNRDVPGVLSARGPARTVHARSEAGGSEGGAIRQRLGTTRPSNAAPISRGSSVDGHCARRAGSPCCACAGLRIVCNVLACR